MENVSYKFKTFKSGAGIEVTVTDEYTTLVVSLLEAAKRAANTKGIERHANENEYFEDQLICEAQRMLGPVGHGGPRFQVLKKVNEACRLPATEAIKELQDAICYLAADILMLEEELNLSKEML